MKKIIVLIFLFAVAATSSYVGFSMGNSELKYKEETSVSSGGFFKSNDNYSSGETFGNEGGFFRNSTEANGPGGRPGSGDGIGQEAPIGDGLFVLTICCTCLIIAKLFYARRKINWKKKQWVEEDIV